MDVPRRPLLSLPQGRTVRTCDLDVARVQIGERVDERVDEAGQHVGDAREATIPEGTSQMQVLQIGKALLGVSAVR